MSRLAPAVSKNFPARKALALNFPLLPVVNSKKQLLGVVIREDLERVLRQQTSQREVQPDAAGKAENQSDAAAPTNKAADFLAAEPDKPSEDADEQARERTLLLRRAGLITYSQKMMGLIDLILRVSRVDSTVLISGESGVGKELLAKLIHDQSSRSLGPFVKINCGAIPENLLESELFGYEGGAFTGASRQGKLGMFELAHGGTLFLDEIGELPLGLQVKLLRAIQEQEFVRVGGVKAKKVDVRFIAATNRELEKMVESGKFREDLYFRLNVIPLLVPPLRERKEDILPLIHHFQAKFTQKFKVSKTFAPEALRLFLNYPWPGNVRELENIVERLFVVSPGEIIYCRHVPEKLLPGVQRQCVKVTGVMPLKEAVDELQRLLIEEALAMYGNTYKAAEALGVEQSTITRKLAKLKEKRKSGH